MSVYYAIHEIRIIPSTLMHKNLKEWEKNRQKKNLFIPALHVEPSGV